MKKLLYTLIILFCGASVEAQVLMDEGFDNGIPERWTTFSDTNTTHNEAYRDAWVVSNEYGNPVPGLVSASWFNTPGRADRWLITDSITIPDSGYVFSVEAAAYEQAYPDGFAVKVSRNGRMFRNNFDIGYLLQVPQCEGGMEPYTASLDAYAGQRIYIAIIQNSNDRNFLIIDNVKIYKPEQHAIALTDIEVPDYALVHSPVIPIAHVKNTGLQTLYSLDIDYAVLDDTIRCHWDDLELFPNGILSLALPTHVIDLPGDHTMSIRAHHPNGIEDSEEDNLLMRNLRVYNINQTAVRHTLVEEFSDLENGYCIDAHNTINEAIEGYVHCTRIVHHPLTGDPLANAGSTGLKDLISDSANLFMPAVMMDRRRLSTNEQVLFYPGNAAMLQQQLIEAQSRPSFVRMNVGQVQFDESSRMLSGSVNGQFLLNDNDSNTRIFAYLVEDSIFVQQYDYGQGDANNNYTYYRPMGTVRNVLSGPKGDPLEVDSTGRFSYALSYRVPTNYRGWRCRVVAAVCQVDTNRGQYQVLNSAQSYNMNATYYGIAVPKVQFDIYPNPVANKLQITCAEPINEVEMTDAMGRMVVRENDVKSPQWNKDVSTLAEGIYFVTVKTAKGTSTAKVVKVE